MFLKVSLFAKIVTITSDQTSLKVKMSKVPMMFRDWWDEYDMDFDNYRRPARTSRLMDQHFGTALRKNDLMSTFANTHLSSPRSAGTYYRPWGQSPLAKQDSGSTINVEKNKYQIILDVQQFTPNEISVKIAEKFIIVEGKHEEKEDEHGYVSRHFTRKYMLPCKYIFKNQNTKLIQ